jgi:hypothetical protein
MTSELYIGFKQVTSEMGVVDVYPAIERFADKMKALVPIC